MHHTARKCENMQRFYLSILYCRVYSSLGSRELCNLKTCVLVDEFKQDLPGDIHQDYGKTLEYILNLKRQKAGWLSGLVSFFIIQL